MPSKRCTITKTSPFSNTVAPEGPTSVRSIGPTTLTYTELNDVESTKLTTVSSTGLNTVGSLALTNAAFTEPATVESIALTTELSTTVSTRPTTVACIEPSSMVSTEPITVASLGPFTVESAEPSTKGHVLIQNLENGEVTGCDEEPKPERCEITKEKCNNLESIIIALGKIPCLQSESKNGQVSMTLANSNNVSVEECLLKQKNTNSELKSNKNKLMKTKNKLLASLPPPLSEDICRIGNTGKKLAALPACLFSCE